MSEHFSHRARLLGHFAMNATVQSHSNHAAHFGTPVKIRLSNALPNIGLRVTGAGRGGGQVPFSPHQVVHLNFRVFSKMSLTTHSFSVRGEPHSLTC